jgi:WD40 repeat protein
MQLLHGHTDTVFVLSFSPDGSLLASASNDGTIRVWQFPDGSERAILPVSCNLVPCVVFSPDGRWLATPGHALRVASWVWDLSNTLPDVTGASTHQIDPRSLPDTSGPGWTFFLAVAFTPDGRHLIVSGEKHGQPRSRSWDVGAWTEAETCNFDMRTKGIWIYPWALDPVRKALATPDYNSTVFWDLRTGNELFRVKDKSVGSPGSLVFSPDGERFAISRSRSIMVCDVLRQRVLATWKNPTTKHIQSLAFSPDGRTLASVSNDTIARFWDAETGREKAAYTWEMGHLKAVAFSPDGMRAAAAGKKGDIVVWDVE